MERAVVEDTGGRSGRGTRPPARRKRNARGQGARLADEIVEGALAIVERTDSVDEVTLRSVARQVGIAAPSIYAHFADVDAIVVSMMVRVFAQLEDHIDQARAAAGSDPVEELVAGCEAYVSFGMAHPQWYRALFSRRHPEVDPAQLVDIPGGGVGGDVRAPDMGARAFLGLVEGIERCAAEGRSASTDSFSDATAVWVALHGVVSLWTTMCAFPWPDSTGLVRRMVLLLARITEPAG